MKNRLPTSPTYVPQDPHHRVRNEWEAITDSVTYLTCSPNIIAAPFEKNAVSSFNRSESMALRETNEHWPATIIKLWGPWTAWPASLAM